MGGVIAIVEYKALSPTPVDFPFYTMYSPHSWLAICLLGLWGIQFAGGALSSWFQFAIWRKYHHFLGRLVYGVALATCALGFQDMQSSDLAGSQPPYTNITSFTPDMIDDMGYFPDSPLAQLACAGVMLLAFQAFTTFLALVE